MIAKYSLLTLSLLCAGVCCATDSPLIPARVNDAIQARLATGEYPVLVVAVVDGDRSDVYSFGKLDNGKPADADTLFEIGSTTKTFTATLLAGEINAGKLTLDTPVATLLPGFTLPARNGHVITLGNLAMQHSGLPRMPDNFVPGNPKDPYIDYNVDRLKTFLAGYSLPRDPGASYEYSNLGVGLLGYALAQRAGTTYDVLVKQGIFAPLGMHDSTIALDATQRAHVAGGHDVMGSVPDWHLNVFTAAGGIKSSGADMLRYLKANMGLMKSTLYPAMQLAQTPVTEGPSPKDRIGLVWMTQHQPSGDIIWHSGMTGGYASFIGFTADRRHGVVVMTNMQQDVDDLGFATISVDVPLAAAHKRVTLSPQALDAYQGSYQLAPALVVRVTHAEGGLVFQATGQGPLPMFASATDEFFANVGEISVSFKRDAHGQVESLVLHQHGDHVAPKLSQADADANQGNKAVALDPKLLVDYIGHYELAPGAAFEVTVKDGQLLVKLGNQAALPVYASARDHFFYRAVDAKLTFERDAGGKVVAVTLHQRGVDKRAPRIGT